MYLDRLLTYADYNVPAGVARKKLSFIIKSIMITSLPTQRDPYVMKYLR